MKISKSKLKELRSLVKAINKHKETIADYEIAKQLAVQKLFMEESKYNEVSKEMTDKYGKDVQLDLNDGTITNASNDLKKT